MSSPTGFAATFASSASTTLTPKPCRSGSGASREIHKKYPDVIFLAEAFTRPHVMYSLAKGYTQSYTYFTWRNSESELQEYFEEITKTAGHRFLSPQPLAQHTRHPPRALQNGAPRIHAAPHSGGHAGRKLRHLRPSLRTMREFPPSREAKNTSTVKSTRSADGIAAPT